MQAMQEMTRLEKLKMDLLREQITKEIEAEAKKETRRTKASLDSAGAKKEKRKAKKELVSQMIPDEPPVAIPQPSIAGPSTPMFSPPAARYSVGNYSSFLQRRYGM
jgi:hypothetical protein